MKEDEMGGTCGTYGGRREMYGWFLWGNLKETAWKTGLDGMMILKRKLKHIGRSGLD
jgi:hypothetical protein